MKTKKQRTPKFEAPKTLKGIPLPAGLLRDKQMTLRIRQPSPWVKFLEGLEPGDCFDVPFWKSGAPMAHGRRLKIPLVRDNSPAPWVDGAMARIWALPRK